MLVDAVIFNDELELLRVRLTLLGDHVDHFVVAESRQTFSGRPKPLHLAENADLFADYADRMTLVEYAVPPRPPGSGGTSSAWERESAARSSLRAAVRELSPDGTVLLCDVDELPSPEQCHHARLVEQMMMVPLDTYSRRANWRVEHESPLLVARVAPVAGLPEDLGRLRWERRPEIPWISGERGAHLTYLGFTADDLARKYRSFSHSELDFPAASTYGLLRLADRMAVDHLGRADHRGRGLLTVQRPQEWASVQRAVHDLHPEWFDVRRHRPPRLARRLSATLIDLVVQGRSPSAARLLAKRGTRGALLGRTGRQVVASTLRQDWADARARARRGLAGSRPGRSRLVRSGVATVRARLR